MARKPTKTAIKKQIASIKKALTNAGLFVESIKQIDSIDPDSGLELVIKNIDADEERAEYNFYADPDDGPDDVEEDHTFRSAQPTLASVAEDLAETVNDLRMSDLMSGSLCARIENALLILTDKGLIPASIAAGTRDLQIRANGQTIAKGLEKQDVKVDIKKLWKLMGQLRWLYSDSDFHVDDPALQHDFIAFVAAELKKMG